MKTISSIIFLLVLSSCVSVEVADTTVENVSTDASGGSTGDRGAASGSRPPAIKNFHQINNTYAQLTGVSAGNSDVLDEFNAIKTQLPSSNDASAANGFNQVAYLRLAFAYCDKYIGNRSSELGGMSEDAIVKDLLDKFVYLDLAKNLGDMNFYNEVLSIVKNEDGLLPGGSGLKLRAARVGCASILASSYVTTL